MSTAETLHVQIGQVKTGRDGQILTAILGSCVGLGFLWPKRGVYGLAHALLAESGSSAKTGAGRHVDQAIDTLLADMNVPRESRREINVILAGGANMTMPRGTDPTRLVGAANAEFAERAIKAARLRIGHTDLGGETGRRVTIDCSTGEYDIAAIPRLGAT